MLSAMQRRQGPEDISTSATGVPSSSTGAAPSAAGGGGDVSFWSSLSVVDSLFSDDPPTRLGQTMSADHAGAFGGAPSSSASNGGWPSSMSLSTSSAPTHQSHLLHALGGGAQGQGQSHLHQMGGSHGALGLQRSSFDEGSFYSSPSASLFSSSPILSPPSSPAIHSLIYSSEEDHQDVRSLGGLGLHQQHLNNNHHLSHHQQQQHLQGGAGGAYVGGGFHSNGLHSTNGVVTRKHNYSLYSNGGAAGSPSSAQSAGGKYSNARPGSSGLPNGAGHKHSGNFGNGYASGGGGYQHQQQQQQFQYAGSGHYPTSGGGYHGGGGGSAGGHFRASPPRSQPIHAPGPRGSSGLGGSGGYPASPPARLRNNGGLGSMPRSSPPRSQQHSYLSTALKGSNNGGVQQQHQGKQQYGSGNIPSISLYAAPTDGNNICFDDEALSPRGSASAVLQSPRLSSSPLLHGSGSQPIQISRSQQGQAGGSMGPRSPSAPSAFVVSTSPISSQLGSLKIDEANETSGLLLLPSTTLLRIFSYLSGSDLGHLEQVCKRRMAYLANDDGLWKDLYLRRYKLLESAEGAMLPPTPVDPTIGDEDSESDEWAWIYSLLQQNERWKDIFKTRFSAEQWRIGSLKMFNGCWGFISQTPNPGQLPEQTLDIFFHRKDIAPDGEWYEDWWLKDTPGVSRSQKCGYWDTFLCGRIVRYKQRAAYAQGRRPQACNISFVGEERRDPITGEPLPALHDAKIAQRSLAAARFG